MYVLLLYPFNVSGYGAGQWYAALSSGKYGGPSNMLCLPVNPELSNLTFPDYSLIYGAEYEGPGFKSDAHDEDVPCAVCRTPGKISTLMLPGRRTCYTGWTMEYNGHIASGHFGETSSEYICVDSAPEYLASGQRNDNGHLLYITKSKCGALPCPPYKDNVALNCVVCSK